MGGPGSGRKKKNQVVGKNVMPQRITNLMPRAQQVTVQQPAGDPFARIEDDLNEKIPVNPVPAAANAVPEQEKNERKAPENLIRMLLNGFYGLEDAYGRHKLGLGEEYKGIFFPNEVIEAHVSPLCKVAEKYCPSKLLANLEKNTPEIILATVFLEAQLGFFSKIAQAKKELGQKNPEKATAPSVNPQTPAGNSGYPKKNEIIQ